MLLVGRSLILMANRITVKQKYRGDDTEQYLMQLNKSFNEEQIKVIAEKSLEKFRQNTPSDSGLTANSWEYTIEQKDKKWIINFNNTNIQNGMNIALLIENGHATPSGKWISGKHYIDKTLKEIQKEIIDNEWEEITKV